MTGDERDVGARILLITGDAPFFSTHFLPFGKAARERGYDVHVATPLVADSGRNDEAAALAIARAGLEFHRIPLSRGNVNLWREIGLFSNLARLLRQIQPDLVHCIGIKPVLYAGAIARLRSIAAVHSVIGLGTPFMDGGLVSAFMRRASLFGFRVALGNPRSLGLVEHAHDLETFLRAKVTLPERLELLGGVGTDMNLFHPPEPNRTSGNKPPIVMFASRLIEPKGPRDFVEAARQLKAAGVKARFVLQCELDLKSAQAIPESEVLRWQDEGIVEWWGCTSNMPAALRSVDIFCLPTYYREGVPKVLIEAAASGLPIITSDIAGCRDVVDDGVNGILVPPRNLAALKRALITLINDVERRRLAGEQSRAIAEQRFSLAAYVKNLFRIYDSLLNGEFSRGVKRPASEMQAPPQSNP